MKKTIAWHQETLKNIKASLFNQRESIRLYEIKANELSLDVMQLEDQINAAIKAKKDGFDRERYLINRKPF